MACVKLEDFLKVMNWTYEEYQKILNEAMRPQRNLEL